MTPLQKTELDRLIKFFSTATTPKGKVQIAPWLSSNNLAATIDSGIIRATNNTSGWGLDAMLNDLKLIERFLKGTNS